MSATKQRGTKSEVAASPLPSRGPKRGWKCYVTPAFSGIPKQRGTKSKLAASPLPSRGPKRGQKCSVTPTFLGVPKQRGTKLELAAKRGRKCCVTPAFLGVPNAKRGDIIRSGLEVDTSLQAYIFSKIGNFFAVSRVIFFGGKRAYKKNRQVV